MKRTSSALPALEQAAANFQRVGADALLARVWTSMGILYRMHGLPEKAIELYRRALAIQERTQDRRGIMQSLDAIAVGYAMLQESAKSIEYYQLALDQARQSGVPAIIAFQTGRLGEGLIVVGQYDRAIRLLDEAVKFESGSESFLNFFGSLSAAYRLSGQSRPSSRGGQHGPEATWKYERHCSNTRATSARGRPRRLS